MASLAALNAHLKLWGYCEDRAQFIAQYDAEHRRARETNDAYKSWARRQDSWVIEGDAMLDKVQRLLSEGTLESFGHTEGL